MRAANFGFFQEKGNIMTPLKLQLGTVRLSLYGDRRADSNTQPPVQGVATQTHSQVNASHIFNHQTGLSSYNHEENRKVAFVFIKSNFKNTWEAKV